MKAPEEDDIYYLFRAKLSGSDGNTFNDENWDQMEQLLNEQPRRKKAIVWLYRLSAGIAAVLLLFFGFYFFKPVAPAINRIAKSSNNNLKSTPGGKLNTLKKPGIIVVAHQVITKNNGLLASITKKQISRKNEGDLIINKTGAAPESVSYVDSINLLPPNLEALNPKKGFGDSIPSLPTQTIAAIDPKKDINPAVIDKKAIKSIHGLMPRLALAVLAAPDINSVNKFGNASQVGTNFGLQFSIQLSPRLSISSGAFYGTKPYQTSSANYRPQTPNWWVNKFGNTGKPDNVVANCKVLDIPLDVNYLLFSNTKNKLTIGSGLSSYFMLKETYYFSFANPSVNSSKFEINNRNQHVLGLINLNATYERKINNRFGILVQPYLKLPITQIGFGQVDLQSTGLAVGLSWNIHPFKTK